MNCPKHIENYIISLTDTNIFSIHQPVNNYHHSYLVKCSCGCEEFEIFINPEPMLMAKCKECGAEITVYNLRYYPAASLISFEGANTKYVSPRDDRIFNICVIYDYPELEVNEEYDQNDITWCVVYGVGIDSKDVFEILNDETA